MFQNVLHHLPIVRHLVPICCCYRESSDGDSCKENYSEEGKKRQITKKMLQNLRQVLHLKLMRPQTEVLALVAFPTASCSQQLSHTPPKGTDILLWLQPSSHPSLQDHIHTPPCGSYSCRRDLPKHSSVIPRCMFYADQTPAKFTKASWLLSSGNTLA